MRFKLVETLGLHWGDLDKGIKAEQRKIGLHGTGHFGTGFYLVNKDNYVDEQGRLKKDYNENRPIYEIDIDSYNLFRPRNNNDGYLLHDSLKDINKYYDPRTFSLIDKDLEREQEGEKEEWEERASDLYDIVYEGKGRESFIDDEDDFYGEFDIDTFLKDPSYYDDVIDEIEATPKDELDKLYEEEYKKLALDFAKEHNLFIDLSDMQGKLNRIDEEVKEAISYKWNSLSYLREAIKDISKLFNRSENDIKRIVAKLNKNDEDTNSTQLIKALGYEGVDVTLLGKDGQGLSGLDNFTYGTVVYDLKPNTYKKIANPIGKSRKGEKI